MSKTRQEKRSKIKPFIKAVNYNHLMPTRYTLELEGLKGALTGETFKEVSQREDAKKNVKKVLEERYTSGKNRWFFTPLSMSYIILSIAMDSRRQHQPVLRDFRRRLSPQFFCESSQSILLRLLTFRLLPPHRVLDQFPHCCVFCRFGHQRGHGAGDVFLASSHTA